MTPTRAANRVLDLAELERPEYAATIAAMERLSARETVSYLHPSKRWEYPWALEQAALPPGSEVLDAGCGASIFPVFLAGQGYRVSACDLDLPHCLDELHGVRVDYRRSDLCALPYADNRFAAIFCISVIEHLPREKMPSRPRRAAPSPASRRPPAADHRFLPPGGRGDVVRGTGGALPCRLECL